VEPALSPTQARIFDQLRRPPEPVVWPEGLATQLEEAIEEELGELAEHLSKDKPIFLNKHALATIHACEANQQATAGKFEWSVPTARGTVAHRAIELSIHWRGDPSPLELVDEALARLVDDTQGVGAWIAGLREADRAALRGEVGDLVTKFAECFPPLKADWWPVTEGAVYADLLGGAVTLQGRPDLTLGRPGSKVVIDFKTGRPNTNHRDDLRYYALLETLKHRTPPRLTATLYLDAARAQVEDVTEGGLWAAARRAVDGVVKLVELERLGRLPVRHAGPTCRWCPLASDCDEGTNYLASLDEEP
jgi:hypothetical protein